MTSSCLQLFSLKTQVSVGGGQRIATQNFLLFLRSTVVLVNTPRSSGETLPLSVRQELELNRRYRRPCVYPTSGRSVSHRAACILFLVLLSHTCTTTSIVFPLTNDVKSGSLLRIIQRAWIKESKEFSNIQFIFRLYSNLFRRFF